MSSNSISQNNNRLKGKDLINVGIYSAIYLILISAVAMLGYIPILMPLLCVIGPIIGGIPFMLYLTKVKKFGMILITGILMGIIMGLTGMGFYALPVAVVSALIAEFVWKKANYAKSAGAIVAYAFFSIWMWGNYLPLFINPAGYFAARSEFGAEYESALTAILPMWTCPVLLICCFVFGLIGGLLGKAILKKHFVKAGIA